MLGTWPSAVAGRVMVRVSSCAASSGGGPRHVILYTSNGEVRQEFSIVFTARPIGGELRPSSESSEPQWVAPSAIPGLQMHPSMRQRIQHYLDKQPGPYLG